mgnify:CR=1 FL=1
MNPLKAALIVSLAALGAFGVGTGQGSLGGGSLVERNLNRWTVALSIAWIIVILLLVIKPYE